MGCGQSKIHLYPRKNKSKSNGKKSGHIEDADADEEDGHNGRDERDREINGEKEKLDEDGSLRDDGSPEPPNGEIVSILRKNGSLLQSQEISSSQQNFFRMLDQKIEEGPDYDSSSETEQALEEARMNALVQHWESASLTTSMCSSTSRSLQGTPVRQVPLRQPPLRPSFQQPLSAELLSQQQLLKQQHQLILQHHQQQQQQQQHQQQQLQLMQPQQQQQQQQQIIHQNFNINMNINSPKRVVGTGNAVSVGGIPVSLDGRQLLSQTIIHQNYGVIQPSQTAPQLRPSSGRTLPTPVQCLQLSYYQQQQQQQLQAHQQQQQLQQQQSQQLALTGGGSGSAATIGSIQPFQQQQQSLPPPHSYYNDILRHPLQLSSGLGQSQQQQSSSSISSVSSALAAGPGPSSSSLSSVVAVGTSGSLLSSSATLQQQTPPSDAPRFPPAISVQRLAPQVQRQIRETQELIKDSCSQLYSTGYGSPGPPPMAPLRTSASAAAARAASVNRRTAAPPPTTLETQYSQELS
ncbi:myb-like protein Q isoform X2 [Aedes aegypti]|uniref:Uncharacterized protein n=1 Tax=Aedes aegypti TaxID=7159 RepID=A0A6I8T4R1_AEDAE|nr:myb-like protein Q isoform X2 [Aedes aegypti]